MKHSYTPLIMIFQFQPNSVICALTEVIFCTLLLAAPARGQSDLEKRKEYLNEILELQRPHPDPAVRPRNVYSSFERLSHKDSTWRDWLERTGELPPDFGSMPSIPFLPDPLILDEVGKNIPVHTLEEWETKRDWIKKQVTHWLSGSFPPAPEKITAKTLEHRMEEDVKVELIELRFGENEKAKLTMEVFTPPGNGPFPVFLTQWNHRGWAQIAVRRGYMALIYAGADDKDDTIHYQKLFPDYDWTALMTRAWGAQRAVDYLYTLEYVNRNQIALTGHSRNAKLSLFAAAFDPRITAVISSSGGTGGEIPYRYTDERHGNESIDYLTSIRPQWLHPRLRFFAEREHKLPIDQNSLMALIAPNSLLLSSSIREAGGGDPWAIEQNYLSLQKVYTFLGVPEKLGVRLRDGDHGVAARDIESFMDWLDIQFGRKKLPWENKLLYNYSFEKWKELSGEEIYSVENPYGSIDRDKDGKTIQVPEEWTKKKGELTASLLWMLGEKPPGIAANPVKSLSARQDYQSLLISRPRVRNGKKMNIAPYNALGDYQYAALYYPVKDNGEMDTVKNGKLPVVVFLHKYVNTGYDASLGPVIEDLLSKGIAVLTMDLVGYGERIEEGALFYDRYPGWSKMGKMVADTQAAIQALEELDFVDKERISISGYALGGTVALITAALDSRISSVAVAAAFNPWRETDKHVEGIRSFSHLYGLLPRLGLYIGDESKVPVDFPEILTMIAPRPVLVISPALDRHANLSQVDKTILEAKKIYQLWNAEENIRQLSPYSYNRFTPALQKELIDWLVETSR